MQAQLAEAILADDGTSEDASSILLDDARSRRASNAGLRGRGQDHERQFLVGNEDEDDPADDVRSFGSSASIDDEPERGKLSSLLDNAAARASHLDFDRYGESSGDEDLNAEPPMRKGNGLAAKAGTIMVRIHFF